MANEIVQDFDIAQEDSTSLIGVEANLEVPPTFQLRRTDPTKRMAEAWNTIVTADGERIEQYWRVSVPEPYELPGSFDQDVWVAVQVLVNLRGGMPPDGVLYFSMYELLRIMRKQDNGDNYGELRDSLLRLAATSFHSDNAFYLKDVNEFDTRTFHPWDVRLRKTVNKKSGRSMEKHSLEFHSLVRRSFQSEYVKELDPDFYFSLRSPLAKRLYRLIDRKAQGKLVWSTTLDKFKEMVPLAPSYRSPSKIEDALKPAHRELLKRGFLEGVNIERRQNHHRIRYKISPVFRRQRPVPQERSIAEIEGAEEDRRTIALLVGNGVWPNVAPDLVRRHGAEMCRQYVEALVHQRGIQDSGAWLRWAIETAFPLPNYLHAQPRLLDDLPTADEDAPHPTDIPAPDPDPAAANLWRRVLDDASFGDSSDETISVWFNSSVPVSFDDKTLTLVVPNLFAKEYVETRFKAALVESLRHHLSPDADLLVLDRDDHTRCGVPSTVASSTV